jgi:hypothetical protein
LDNYTLGSTFIALSNSYKTTSGSYVLVSSSYLNLSSSYKTMSGSYANVSLSYNVLSASYLLTAPGTCIGVPVLRIPFVYPTVSGSMLYISDDIKYNQCDGMLIVPQLSASSVITTVQPIEFQYTNPTIVDHIKGGISTIILDDYYNLLLSMSNVPNGGTGVIEISQSSVGNNLLSYVTHSGLVTKYKGGSKALSTQSNMVDLLRYERINNTLYITIDNKYLTVPDDSDYSSNAPVYSYTGSITVDSTYITTFGPTHPTTLYKSK